MKYPNGVEVHAVALQGNYWMNVALCTNESSMTNSVKTVRATRGPIIDRLKMNIVPSVNQRSRLVRNVVPKDHREVTE